jgi:2-dehydro-3-deoxyphosphogluconate aldolase / (4S)-4-hydroxy-2-oxoglutarate aldolase
VKKGQAFYNKFKNMKQNNIRGILGKHQVIPVVTFNEQSEIEPTLTKLKAHGISCIEITLRTPFALEAISYVKKNHSTWMTVGVGTLIDEDQLLKVKEIGVDFIVCPGTNYALLPKLEDSGIAFIPGIVTPTEIMNGIEKQLNTFKFFPANLFGGIETLKTYAQVFPEIKFCPTGGVNEETYKDYLNLTNIISVGGSWMLK